MENIDFAYTEIAKELRPQYQEISSTGEISCEIPKTIHKLSFDIKPPTNETYCFAGITQPSLLKGEEIPILSGVLRIVKDLNFIREDGSGYIYVFKPQNPIEEHKYFQGCSGAPVIDSNGNIISLVTGGDIDKDEIYGVNLNRHKIAIDIDAGLIK